MGPKPKPLAERFWRRVDQNGPVPPHRADLGPCWVWTAALDGDGYGHIARGGMRGPKVRAHRVAWELAHGSIPSGQGVLHHCDNRACVNVAHLFLGNCHDNNADMIRKGRARAPKGELHGSAKLAPHDVVEIRRRCTRGESQRAIAKDYGIHQVNVSLIARRITWTHLAESGAAAAE